MGVSEHARVCGRVGVRSGWSGACVCGCSGSQNMDESLKVNNVSEVVKALNNGVKYRMLGRVINV